MTITNAGVGSGLDLEAIISATVQASNQPKLQKILGKRIGIVCATYQYRRD